MSNGRLTVHGRLEVRVNRKVLEKQVRGWRAGAEHLLRIAAPGVRSHRCCLCMNYSSDAINSSMNTHEPTYLVLLNVRRILYDIVIRWHKRSVWRRRTVQPRERGEGGGQIIPTLRCCPDSGRGGYTIMDVGDLWVTPGRSIGCLRATGLFERTVWGKTTTTTL